MRLLTVACLTVVVCSPGAWPRSDGFASQARQQTPSRDRRQARTGTAQLSGRVVVAGTGAPLRGATITLTVPDGGGRRTTRTDPNGRYSFADLPAGSYGLQASRTGYVPLRFGASDSLEPGRRVTLADGQTFSRGDFSLPRAAAISGRVLDEYGEPVADVEVRVVRYQSASGQRRLITASRIRTTDDLGAFRLFGLLPGTYYIAASRRDSPSESDEEQPNSYAPTYYPATAEVDQAQRLTVGQAEELHDLMITLVPVHAARIAGVVVDSQGQPGAGARVTAVRREGTHGFVTVAETRVRRDGAFEVSGVAPGSYAMQVWLTFPADQRAPEFGATPVVVTGRDVDGVNLVTRPGGAVRGQVVFRGDEKPAFGPSVLEISARPVNDDVRYPVGRGSIVRARKDWTFELTGLAGPRLIRASGMPAPWALDAILLDGREVTDSPLEFKSGEVASDLEVVLTDRTTDIRGVVEGGTGASPARISVIAFAEDGARWGPGSRFVQIRRADQGGAFAFIGLPPGRYLIVAVPYVWQGEWNDPDFLERVQPAATRLTLVRQGKHTLRLKLAPLP